MAQLTFVKKQMRGVGKAGRQYGWKGYVVPCDMLRDELLARKDVLLDEDLFREQHNQADGWKTIICERASAASGRSFDSLYRRLFDAMSGVSAIMDADTAETLFDALDVHMDRCTTMPTLPGSRAMAREMVDVHAEFHDPDMTEEEKADLAKHLFNFCTGFVFHDAREKAAEVIGGFLRYYA